MERVDKGTELGTKVFIRSNENEPIKFGSLVDGNGKFSSEIPIVKVGKKRYFACGIVLVYTPDVIAELNGLSPNEQWRLLRDRLVANHGG